MKPSRQPNDFPGEALFDAIHDRLNGSIFRIDTTTAVPIYDSFPNSFDADEWNFIELSEAAFGEGEEPLHLWEVTVAVGVYSSYQGYLELNRELAQVHQYLSSPLDLSSHQFEDSSLGGDLPDVRLEKIHVEENVVVRRGIYRRRWKVSDHF